MRIAIAFAVPSTEPTSGILLEKEVGSWGKSVKEE